MSHPFYSPQNHSDAFADTGDTQPTSPAVQSAPLSTSESGLPIAALPVPLIRQAQMPPLHDRGRLSFAPTPARGTLRNQRPPASGQRANRLSSDAPRRRRGASNTAPRGSATRRTGGGRGVSFTDLELENVLEVPDEHFPVGGDEWEAVTRIHQSRWPEANRSTDSLRRKFVALYRKRLPTGDPRILSSVLKAKEIRAEITACVDIGEREEVNADAFFSEEEEREGEAEVIEGSDSKEGSEDEARRLEADPRSTTPSTSGPVFPIFHNQGKGGKEDDNAAVTELIKATTLQEQHFRAAVREQYEQEREENCQKPLKDDQLRAERREDEERRRQYQEKQAQLQREEDRKMSENRMQMPLMVLARGSDPQSNQSLPLSLHPSQALWCLGPNGTGYQPVGNQQNNRFQHRLW